MVCQRTISSYSGVSNKRPGRLFFFKIFAFGTVIETGTLIFFPTFLESGTIIMLLSALVRLLGFEDCACETAVLKDCEQYDVQRKHPPSPKKKRQKSKKSSPVWRTSLIMSVSRRAMCLGTQLQRRCDVTSLRTNSLDQGMCMGTVAMFRFDI